MNDGRNCTHIDHCKINIRQVVISMPIVTNCCRRTLACRPKPGLGCATNENAKSPGGAAPASGQANKRVETC